MSFSHVRFLVGVVLSTCLVARLNAAEGLIESPPDSGVHWHTQYGAAYKQAKDKHQMLLMFFYGERSAARSRDTSGRYVAPHYKVLAKTLRQEAVQRELKPYTLAVLPTNVTVTVKGQAVKLLQHASLRELGGRDGLVIVDLRDPKSKHYGDVISQFPARVGDPFKASHFREILNLPTGTLTQRTLIYAVRIHPEKPASARAKVHNYLLSETEAHSLHQAKIGVQGHHNWDARFHRINGRLGGGLLAQEVCAESWPGQGLVESAIECVHSWRQSPGHWSAVSSQPQYFGYDMKRGSNGIWYGTGIFAHRN